MVPSASDGAVGDPQVGVGTPPVVLLRGDANRSPELLGNKGYWIDVMRRHGLPVPPAFCITTEVCRRYLADPSHTLDAIWGAVRAAMSWLETQTARAFGAGPRPLLVSVRSGAAQSMPGMLDTVLNLGFNDVVEAALARLQSPEFASDTRQRFRQMYRRIVLADENGEIPEDPFLQLRGAVGAVISSWNSPRAIAYRDHHNFSELGGTAVVVQAMVFGNSDSDSGAGVLFSRNPLSGHDEPFGEWLPTHQGEDVVAGTRDAEPIRALRDEHPSIYHELTTVAADLERIAKDVQDIEFTVEQGKLWLLQTRNAKRSAQAAVRFALALRDEGVIDDCEVLCRINPAQIETLLRPSLQPQIRLAAKLLAKGLPACPGVASGTAYNDVDEAIDAAEAGRDVILVRSTTRPDDIHAMMAARGIVTEIGGVTSHAAVVSRELQRPSVVGCGDGTVEALIGKQITVDGSEGEVREGLLELTAWSEGRSPELVELADIARQHSPLRAHASGDYPALDDTSEAGVRAALDAGCTDVVSAHPLTIMVMAARLADRTTPD